MAAKGLSRLAAALAVAGAAGLALRTHRRAARAVAELVRERDASEQERAASEAALRQSSELLESLIAGIPGAMFRCRPDDEWTAYFVSDSIETLSGYRPAEFLGSCVRSFASLVHPDDLPAAAAARRSAADGEPYSVEYRVLHADGSVRWAQERGRGVFDAEGRLCWIDGVVFDVSERHDLEARLGQAQRLESVGRLAGRIAHDFNNHLTAIRGYAELLQATLEDHERRRDVAEIQRAADRAASLVGQLLAFSRRQMLRPVVLDLNRLVEELTPMLRRLIGEDVELVTQLDPDLGHVRADPSQLEQVILNLAVNARDAMPSGGQLTIETRNGRDRGSASFVTLRVTDTGTGMDAATLAHAFEPFFTTRGESGGTGLGLATVYGIVTQSGGRILAESDQGDGATFTIHLPRVEAPLELPEHPAAGPEAGRGSETILLVEDDEVVRELARRVLEEQGYRVSVARNGAEALTLARQAGGPPDVLVTDVVMPKLGGNELARSLRKTRPGLRVLFMSGYAPEVVSSDAFPEARFLPKPFSPAALAAEVRALLDARERLAG
jgi:PAS domain S-box-containing protein